MSKLIIVSNRLPVTVSRSGNNVSFRQSVGGLATGISSLSQPRERLWFGWPGLSNDKLTPQVEQEIFAGLKDRGCYPVMLSSKDIRGFYSGFSNRTIWPLFHYFTEHAVFKNELWDAYRKVNQIFCDEIIPQLGKKDKIWIHDYQLMLLPQMIREKVPDAQIGFFLHIPFPSFELIRLLPWRNEILEGMLGADLIGFHEYDYVRHFLSSIYRIAGFEHMLSELVVGDRLVRVDAFPMGIDYEKYAHGMELPEVKKEIKKITTNKSVRIIASVDRLDYTKGILKRLEAFDWFLTKNPTYHEKVSLVVIAVPSRTKVEQYDILRDQIEKIVGRINGTYGTLNWMPVSYMYRSLPFDKLVALYNVADVALITPLRDGMNLVAKEFVACQHKKEHQGILVLSEMAGAASELVEAIVVNPHDKLQVVDGLKQALEMPQQDRRQRNSMMRSRLSRYTVARWAHDFIHSLNQIKEKQKHFLTTKMSHSAQQSILRQYRAAKHRLFLFDYDGTLVPFVKDPEDAQPDTGLLRVLKQLIEEPSNEIVIISGRNKSTLTNWLSELPIHLIAEHGAFFRLKNGQWQTSIPAETSWKDVIRPILELYVDRTPGSLLEEKDYSLVWHCRKSEPDLAKLRTQELKGALMTITANLNIGVFEGSKIVEVKHLSVNKGEAVRMWLSNQNWPFIFCAGDDYTDEDMFAALPEDAISCKIGVGPSRAGFRLNSPQELREFLIRLQESDNA